jgi:hypothetical protein
VTEGPVYLGAICYWRIKAVISEASWSEIIFSKDDSNGAFGSTVAQVNLYDVNEVYTLSATVSNAYGSNYSYITLDWPDKGVLTASGNSNSSSSYDDYDDDHDDDEYDDDDEEEDEHEEDDD